MTDAQQDAGAGERPRWSLDVGGDVLGHGMLWSPPALVAHLNALEDRVQALEQRVKEEHAAALDVWASLETAEQQLREAKAIGQRLHDWIDEYNNTRELAGCRVCNSSGYDANGLIHREDCALHQWRIVTPSPAQPTGCEVDHGH